MSHRAERFTDTSRNASSLEPRPAQLPDAGCLHRQVVAGAAASEFSRERGHPVFPVQVPGRAVSMSVGVLEPGGATSNHRHAYEALTYFLAGRGHTVIEGQRFDWQAGDALLIPPWCWHQHVAAADCRAEYLTATNMPALEALGQTVMRQEQE